MKEASIQLWIGDNFSSEEEYKKYFENTDPLNYEPYNICPFYFDIKEQCYTTESLEILPRTEKSQSIEDIVNIIKVNKKEKVLQQCLQLGIEKANAVFWYVNMYEGFELNIDTPKDNYNKLKYIGNFLAGDYYSFEEDEDVIVEPTNQHLWVGTNLSPVKEYNKYFKLDYSVEDINDPSYKVCDFCQDIGIRWYDEDFIGYPKPLKKEVSITKLIEKFLWSGIPCENQIVKRCNELGIEKANVLFWYSAAETDVKKPYKDNYNGLKYIGKFEF